MRGFASCHIRGNPYVVMRGANIHSIGSGFDGFQSERSVWAALLSGIQYYTRGAVTVLGMQVRLRANLSETDVA